MTKETCITTKEIAEFFGFEEHLLIEPKMTVITKKEQDEIDKAIKKMLEKLESMTLSAFLGIPFLDE